MSNNVKPQLGEFCWNELMTPDMERSQSFYATLFGWTTQNHDMGDKTYTIFMLGDKGIGGMMQIPRDQTEQIPPHWMSYICVEDVEKTLEKAQSLGASIEVPVTNVKEMGCFAIIKDPTGAHIAFWQSAKPA